MRAQLARIVATACAGRDPEDLIVDLALASALACLLWIAACVFMVLEPMS